MPHPSPRGGDSPTDKARSSLTCLASSIRVFMSQGPWSAHAQHPIRELKSLTEGICKNFSARLAFAYCCDRHHSQNEARPAALMPPIILLFVHIAKTTSEKRKSQSNATWHIMVQQFDYSNSDAHIAVQIM